MSILLGDYNFYEWKTSLKILIRRKLMQFSPWINWRDFAFSLLKIWITTRCSKVGECYQLTLFRKSGSSIKYISNWEKFRILPSSYSQKKIIKLYFYLFSNLNFESTNNYTRDDFEITKKVSHHKVLFFNIFSVQREKLVFLKQWCK